MLAALYQTILEYQKMNRNIFLIGTLMLLLISFGIVACHSGGGAGSYDPLPSPWPTETSTATATPTATPTAAPTPDATVCFNQSQGTWSFATSSSSGTITLNSSGEVSGITQSSCSGMTIVASESASSVDGNNVLITYTATCQGTNYTYTMVLHYVDNCNTMSGTKTGNYSGGITENIALTKQ